MLQPTRITTTLAFFLSFTVSIAAANLDSLWSIWQDKSKHDTTRLNALGRHAWDGFLFTNPDSAYQLAQIQYDFAQNSNQKKYMAKALNIQGVAHYFRGNYEDAVKAYEASHNIYVAINLQGGAASTMNNVGLIYQEQRNYEKALEYTLRSKRIYEEMGSEKGIATSLNNLGLIYENQGDFIEAIECYSKSIRIHEKMGNLSEVVNGYANIGNIYKAQKDYETAIKYYTKSLKLLLESEDFYSEAIVRGNLGLTYLYMGNYKKALECFDIALNLQKEMKNELGMANVYLNFALLYQEKKEYEKALDYYNKSMPIFEKNDDQEGVAIVLNNEGEIYFRNNRINDALGSCKRSLDISLEINSFEQIRNSAETLWKVYKKKGDFTQSLAMHELYVAYRDSINSDENKKELMRQEVMMDHEKQVLADSLRNFEAQKAKDIQIAQEKAENEKQKVVMYFLFGGLVLVLLFSVIIANRLRFTRSQKRIIEIQKEKVDLAYDQVEMKNQEITDSITYAKRIQSAILPSEASFKKHFPQSFILYKPKDIVAGDFYWMREHGDQLLLAVADCTGHGVPGAMVSVICNHSLSQAVKEYNLTNPGEILDKTRALIIEEFEKSSDAVYDGMDIALINLKYQFLNGEKVGAELKFSGAYNPIWIVKQNQADLIEIKGNKQPIGRHKIMEPFTTHKINLRKNDCVYLITDGFADQFGGERGKKLKTTNFKNLIMSYTDLPMEKQGQNLDDFFNNWGKVHEQIDDVCVIGIRV